MIDFNRLRLRDRVRLGQARELARLGTCARRAVGCLLVAVRGRILSEGYNGPPAGWPHCINAPCSNATVAASGEALETCQAIHAEQNALMRCPDPDLIHTCYVTVSPCLHCVKMLLNTGCRRIVFAEPYAAHHDAARALWMKKSGDVSWEHIVGEL